MLKRLALRAAALAVLSLMSATIVAAQRSASSTSKAIDRGNIDTTCAPCTDFYEFANGTWLKRHTIPPDETSLGRRRSHESRFPQPIYATRLGRTTR